MKSILLFVAITTLSFSSFSAVLITDSNGILRGANNVDVNGVYYDVQFRDGKCWLWFNGCDEESDFIFANPNDPDDETLVRAALESLLTQVFVDGPAGNFDSDPSLTHGGGSYSTAVQTPFRLERVSSRIRPASITNHSLEHHAAEGNFDTRINYTIDSSTSSTHRVWAVWSESSITQVPLPASAWLFGSAIAGILGLRLAADKSARRSNGLTER